MSWWRYISTCTSISTWTIWASRRPRACSSARDHGNGHVEALAERILFLKGDVVMAAAELVKKIIDPAKMLEKTIEMEQSSAQHYNSAVQTWGANADAVSKQLFERLVGEEEGHQNEFERQLENIKRFGPGYLALQSFGIPVGAPETT
jgi:bacterioferritin (cytochrome b1)